MTAYLRTQQGGVEASGDVDAVAGSVFFHMWRNRQHPFAVLADGDTIYLVDSSSRTIQWEFRVANLRKFRYSSLVDAFRQLDQLFGISPTDCNDYVWSRSPEGWLMAFSVEVVRPLSIALPDDLNLVQLGGRNGWVDVEKLDDRTLASLGLPPVGSPAVAPAAAVNDDAERSGSRPGPGKPNRYIPIGVKQLVLARDGRRCRECGRDDADMKIHFDHIFPWSKGGPNNPENLQILCAEHNMKKAARVLPGVERPVDAWNADEWSDEIKRLRRLRSEAMAGDPVAAFDLAGEVPDDEASQLLYVVLDSDRTELVPRAAAELAFIALDRGNLDEAERLAKLAHAGSDPESSAQAALVLAALANEGSETNRRLLEEAMRSNNQGCASVAALSLATLEVEGTERQAELLQVAMKSPDRETRAEAALYLADFSSGDEVEQLLYEAISSERDFVRENAALDMAVLLYEKGRRTPVVHLLDQARRSSIPDVVEEAERLRAVLDLDD